MKKGFSVEFKIIFAVTVVMLALVTAVVARQIFKNNNRSMKFVYNSAQVETVAEVNISDIFSEI